MAKTKVYFWLKIDKKFFDNLFIKRLKSMPGGYTMTVIYMRMMLESLESDSIKFATDFVKLQEILNEKANAEAELEHKYERWEYLNNLAEEIENSKK